jgi:hypothetical protein
MVFKKGLLKNATIICLGAPIERKQAIDFCVFKTCLERKIHPGRIREGSGRNRDRFEPSKSIFDKVWKGGFGFLLSNRQSKGGTVAREELAS